LSRYSFPGEYLVFPDVSQFPQSPTAPNLTSPQLSGFRVPRTAFSDATHLPESGKNKIGILPVDFLTTTTCATPPHLSTPVFFGSPYDQFSAFRSALISSSFRENGCLYDTDSSSLASLTFLCDELFPVTFYILFEASAFSFSLRKLYGFPVLQEKGKLGNLFFFDIRNSGLDAGLSGPEFHYFTS